MAGCTIEYTCRGSLNCMQFHQVPFVMLDFIVNFIVCVETALRDTYGLCRRLRKLNLRVFCSALTVGHVERVDVYKLSHIVQ